MANKIFYDHLILFEEISSELEPYSENIQDLAELMELVDRHLHHHTLNVIFTHLPACHHEEFISLLSLNPQDEKLLDYLKERISVDIEKEITLKAEQIKKEILSEIKSREKKHG
jgi:hypothetical protein